MHDEERAAKLSEAVGKQLDAEEGAFQVTPPALRPPSHRHRLSRPRSRLRPLSAEHRRRHSSPQKVPARVPPPAPAHLHLCSRPRLYPAPRASSPLLIRQVGGKAGSSTEVQAFSAMSANPLRMESYNSEVDRPSPCYQDRVVTTTKIE